MHPRTTELRTALEQSHAELRAAIDAIPAAQRSRAHAADRWSAAQVVEHLAHTAASVALLLTRGLRRLERAGLRPATDHSAVLPTIDAERLRDRSRKVAAPAAVQPTHGLDFAQAWQAFGDARQQLLDALHASDGIDVGAIVAPHPVLGELDFHRWVAFVALHEQRHAAQLREVVSPG
ncbi:MAG: DinB family protein [Planctomycetes bacterium]|nr:DinB family protein [Planctomycetota bacterium]